MDFALDDSEQGVQALAKKILTDLVTEESLRGLDRSRFLHEAAWKALAEAGLLGVAMSEKDGGADLGVLSLCLLLRQVGRVAGPLPVLPTLAMGALPLARYGTDSQRQKWLRPVAAGDGFLSAAPGPAVPATSQDGGFRLNGACTQVPGLPLAQRVLVPARADGKTVVLLVDPHADGVEVVRATATNGEPLCELRLTDVKVVAEDVLGAPGQGDEVAKYIEDCTLLGVCALMLGVAERAMVMTANYATERHQFGKPIGSFQAVGQRTADCYIDVAAMKVSLWQAAWRLQEGLDCTRELAIAKLWAADGGHRVVVAAQHIHGGMGFDRDYPLHRSFVWAKRLEFVLGGAAAQVARLGDLVAERARAGVAAKAAE